MIQDLDILWSESQAVESIATNTYIESRNPTQGPCPHNKSSFVWSAKSQKLSQLELIGNIEMLLNKERKAHDSVMRH